MDSGIMGDGSENCEISSLFVNGTSFEEIKEIALNMKLPINIDKQTIATA